MKVFIFEMRAFGIEVPRRRVMDGTRHEGELTIATVTDHGLHRPVSVARLRALGQTQIMMELVEPRILWMEQDRFVLTGFERKRNQAGMKVDYAQSWLCMTRVPIDEFDDEGGRWKYGRQSRH